MQQWSKKMMAGTIAASVLAGGGLLAALHNNAYADPAATDNGAQAGQAAAADNGAAAADNGGHQMRGHRGGDPRGGHGPRGGGDFRGDRAGFGGGRVIDEAAALLGIDRETLQQELAQNKTIAQVAQEKKAWSEDELLQQLTAVETKAIADAQAAGKLTQEQADAQMAGLADRLKREVEGAGPAAGFPRGGRGHHGGGFGGAGPFADPAALAQAIGITPDGLKAGLDSGKSPAEIAEAKGISQEQLIAKLKDGLTDKLTQAINRKRPAATAGN